MNAQKHAFIVVTAGMIVGGTIGIVIMFAIGLLP